jgi:conjugal transfer pilus assembly protein TraW
MSRHSLTLAILLLCSAAAHGENLGSSGQTYALDQDAREQLKDVVRRKQASGEMDKFWKDYRDKVVDAVKNPKPLGIKSDYNVHNEQHDLRFTLPQDYKNERGQIVARRGTVIQPLRIQPLKTGLIFIDGRDQRQIDYAIKLGRKQPLKIVLTAGSPFALRVKYQKAQWRTGTGIPFYFDQRKIIIASLNQLYGVDINSVPTTIYQKGEKLSVDYGMAPL